LIFSTFRFITIHYLVIRMFVINKSEIRLYRITCQNENSLSSINHWTRLKLRLLSLLKLVIKKRQPARLVNVTRFASKRYCKKYYVPVTFTNKPDSVYWLTIVSLAVALFSYFYWFLVNFTNSHISVNIFETYKLILVGPSQNCGWRALMTPSMCPVRWGYNRFTAIFQCKKENKKVLESQFVLSVAFITKKGLRNSLRWIGTSFMKVTFNRMGWRGEQTRSHSLWPMKGLSCHETSVSSYTKLELTNAKLIKVEAN